MSGVERPVGEETDGAAVPEGEGAAFAVLEVRLEGGFLRAVVDPEPVPAPVPAPPRSPKCSSCPPARTRVGHHLTVEPEFAWRGRGGVGFRATWGAAGRAAAECGQGCPRSQESVPWRYARSQEVVRWRWPCPSWVGRGWGERAAFGLLTVPGRSRRFAGAMQERGETT